MSSHELHRIIGEALLEFSHPPNCEVIWAPESGGNHTLPLFCSQEKSSDTRYCLVDGLLVQRSAIRVILEIEESDNRPFTLAGKVYAAALSRWFIHRTKGDKPIPMNDPTLFIEILNTGKLSKRTKKPEQWRNLQKSLRETLPLRGSCISDYKLLWGDPTDFGPSGEKRRLLIEHVRFALGQENSAMSISR